MEATPELAPLCFRRCVPPQPQQNACVRGALQLLLDEPNALPEHVTTDVQALHHFLRVHFLEFSRYAGRRLEDAA